MYLILRGMIFADERQLCVGDPVQLPATVLSRRATFFGLSQSLHDRLMYACKYNHVMLNVQYRMRPDISSFPSAQFYNSQIVDGNNVLSPCYAGQISLLDGNPYAFLSINGKEEKGAGGSSRNQAEACCVLDLIKKLKSSSLRKYIKDWSVASRIRVITFYQAQVALIKQLLSKHNLSEMVVATVDSSQGCEADIVILSFVRTAAAGFLRDDRRMNVALTRAKYQLICVGNVDALTRMSGISGTVEEVLKDARSRRVVQQYQY